MLNSSNILSLRELKDSLGGDICGRGVSAPGPGHSPRDRSLMVTPDANAPDGFLVHSFAGDDFRDCRDHVKDRLGIGRSGYKPKIRTSQAATVAADDTKRVSMALSIWNETKPLLGTLAARYLDSRWCLLDEMSSDIRFHPELWHKVTARPQPAMVALMRDIRTNEPCGIHRTYLNQDATKLDRMMLGRAKGACVKLTDDSEVTSGLGIAEGIETALSVMRCGFRPMWSCLSAGTIKNFTVLPGIEALTVFADADFAGIDAAKTCVQRWRDAGQHANALIPEGGGDYNDEVPL